MTRGAPQPDGKLLIVGGGIANFTNVADTFKGIIRALKEYQTPLQQHKVRIFVRRGGPNYQEGLKAMRLLGETLGVDIEVFGPETHITHPVTLALSKPSSGSDSLLPNGASSTSSLGAMLTPVGARTPTGDGPLPSPSLRREQPQDRIIDFTATSADAPHQRPWYRPYDNTTRSLVYGLQPRAIQGMLDFDFACGRKTPSVAAMIYPFGGNHVQACSLFCPFHPFRASI